jgi:hypothetical protein
VIAGDDRRTGRTSARWTPRGGARTPVLPAAFLGALAAGGGVSVAAASATRELPDDLTVLLFLFAGSGFAALIAAYFMLQRFFERRSAADAALVLAFASLAAAGFGAYANLSSPDPLAHVLLGAGASSGAAFLCCALLARDAPGSHRDLGVAAAVIVVAVVLARLEMAELTAGALFFAAALGFAARAYNRDDPMSATLAAGAVLGLYSSLDRLLLTPAATAAGASLMLVCSVLTLGAATLGARRSWEERSSRETGRRVAEKLHSGLAQELALLLLESRRRLQTSSNDPLLGEIVESSERALDETRHVIAMLTRPAGLPYHLAVAREVREVAARHGLDVHLDIDETEVSEEAGDVLLLVIRESLALVATECGATTATVTLKLEGRPVVWVRHNGSENRGRRRSLDLIERRAASIGGSVHLAALPGRRLVQLALP